MSSRPIHEEVAKTLIYNSLCCQYLSKNPIKIFTSHTGVSGPYSSWLLNNLLVAKPDVLVKRRGKLGLVSAGKNFEDTKLWLSSNLGKNLKIGSISGVLDRFLVEPFIPHKQTEEYYVCIYTERNCNVILFHHEGGVDVGEIERKAARFVVPVSQIMQKHENLKTGCSPDVLLNSGIFSGINCSTRTKILAEFIVALHEVFDKLHFTYLEINPLVICDWTLSLLNDNKSESHILDKSDSLFVHILDVAAKLDQCAEHLPDTHVNWLVNGKLFEFPTSFGKTQTPEEAHIAELDAHTGASLKFTLLNPNGRIWTMSAGGGASVIYADTVCVLAERVKEAGGKSQGAQDLANYGEYSGAPSEGQTYEYSKTILSLMTRGDPHPDGKVLLIGGGVANFTNVAETFKGIITALKEFKELLILHNVRIFVRRAGPNYQEGLRNMRDLGQVIGVPIYVFGPETHMTAIVSMAFGLREIPPISSSENLSTETMFTSSFEVIKDHRPIEQPLLIAGDQSSSLSSFEHFDQLFTDQTQCLIWGLQIKAIQSMLDFDYTSGRNSPSVAAVIYPFNENHEIKLYWGAKEFFLPVYKSVLDAIHKHRNARVLVNFASLRVAFDVCMEAMAVDYVNASYQDLSKGDKRQSNIAQIKCIVIIAEGIPENFTRRLIQRSKERNILLIGPATVGGLKAGCFKVGNSGGMIDNILASRLYQSGSVAYVSRSGGMSNELNNIISRNSDGVEEGVAIGGDRFPGSTFLDHMLRFEDNPNVHMIVMLGEVGGVEEYAVIEAVKSGRIRKPIVAWCIGTCAQLLSSSSSDGSIQFGHAGACANSQRETATAKNEAMAQVGINVPSSFDELDFTIRRVYDELLRTGRLIPKPVRLPKPVPLDYVWAKELGLVRRPAAFTSTICDDRGQELLYAGIPISQVIKEDIGIGGVLSLLWFKRRLPDYALKFLELCLIITADHGPAVSGAHNTIIAARAGKDLISSLTSGLLTIGDRFGGAMDAAARQFSKAFDMGLTPTIFVAQERQASRLIMGIGHRIKSINNPDSRVQLLSNFVHQHFPATPIVDYAFAVEKVTTSKRPNLILNVDGMIGVSMVDLLRNCGHFTRQEADEYVNIGTLNGLFVLGRSIGFIGHFLDQKRLHQGLYRHPWEDISYILPENI